jgi:hypothetical protein
MRLERSAPSGNMSAPMFLEGDCGGTGAFVAIVRPATTVCVVPEEVRDIAFLMIPDLLVGAIGHG